MAELFTLRTQDSKFRIDTLHLGVFVVLAQLSKPKDSTSFDLGFARLQHAAPNSHLVLTRQVACKATSTLSTIYLSKT
jgi:hypothetical protein